MSGSDELRIRTEVAVDVLKFTFSDFTRKLDCRSNDDADGLVTLSVLVDDVRYTLCVAADEGIEVRVAFTGRYVDLSDEIVNGCDARCLVFPPSTAATKR